MFPFYVGLQSDKKPEKDAKDENFGAVCSRKQDRWSALDYVTPNLV